MIELEIVGGPASGNKVVTNAAYVTIGRSQADTLVIPDLRVSWHHGEISRRGDEYLYKDLSSTGGTTLRRGNVERPVERLHLSEGDSLLLAGEENTIHVNLIAPDESAPDDFTLTLGDTVADVLGEPEELFADDTKALRALLRLDKAIRGIESGGRSSVLSILVEHVAELYPELDYVAVMGKPQDAVEVVQSLPLLTQALPRTSSTIIGKAHHRELGFVFCVQSGQLLSLTSQDAQDLSQPSATIEHDTSGICVPLDIGSEEVLYLQMERALLHGDFDQRDLNLVSMMTRQAAEHLRRLKVESRYIAASQRAALGIFAGMLGHDIKNALLFAPFLQEILDDPSKHPDILLGVQRAHGLAVSLQKPARSDEKALTRVRVGDLADEIAQSLSSMFSGLCHFEAKCITERDTVTTHEELLRRVIGNLVLNAYAAHVNRKVPVERRRVGILVDSAESRNVRIGIKDNAGGMDDGMKAFFLSFFASLAKTYALEEDLIQVVEQARQQSGAPGRVGLFFTAVAVNDMAGSITLESERNVGTTFTIQLPKKIDRLRGLLAF